MPQAMKIGIGEVRSLVGTKEKIGWLLWLAFDWKNQRRAM